MSIDGQLLAFLYIKWCRQLVLLMDRFFWTAVTFSSSHNSWQAARLYGWATGMSPFAACLQKSCPMVCAGGRAVTAPRISFIFFSQCLNQRWYIEQYKGKRSRPLEVFRIEVNINEIWKKPGKQVQCCLVFKGHWKLPGISALDMPGW